MSWRAQMGKEWHSMEGVLDRVRSIARRLLAGLAGWRWIGLLALTALAIWLAGRGLPDGRLHVYFLDVGQGDAILVHAPDGRQLLIDGGPSPVALLGELGDTLPFWDHTLDLVVLTHPDADHMTGLIALPERYRIAQVLDSPLSAQTPEASPWLMAVEQAAIPRHFARRGMVLDVGDLKITVLHPGPQLLKGTPADDNNNSTVLRLDYGQTSFLLTADIEYEAEADLIEAGIFLPSDVLKIGHHGSRRSTSPAFVDAVRPRLAVIQVGQDNDFGHPHPEVLSRLAGIEVLRTDQHGRIEVVSNGKDLWVRTAR